MGRPYQPPGGCMFERDSGRTVPLSGEMLNRGRIRFPLRECLRLVAMLGLIPSANAASKSKRYGTGLSCADMQPPVKQLFSFVILSLLFLVSSTCARAQNNSASPTLLDKSLEELMNIQIDTVYRVSRFRQKVTEAPASVTIVTSEEIQKYGYRTLADILRNVRGFYVTYDRNYNYLGVRGYGPPGDYNSRIALMIDGHRLNDNIYDGAMIGTEFPIDVDLIERVEVIRGPNSSQYIASSFLGVINIITKRGRDIPRLSVAGEAASYGTYEGRVSYGKKFNNGLEMLLSGSFYTSHGPDQLFFPAFDHAQTNNGVALNADDDQF